MDREQRETFNASFSEERYAVFLEELNSVFPGAIDFRIAETPVFIDKALGQQMIDTCEYIIDTIKKPDFLSLTEGSIPASERVPAENDHPHFVAIDFGLCTDENGNLYPALIEMQGFPTLFGFQAFYPQILEKHFAIDPALSHYFNGLDQTSYINLLKEVIVGDLDPEAVVLLDIRPESQKTRIDFYCTAQYLGIHPVCLSALIQEGRSLFYMLNGKKTRIQRIYNRVIADELHAGKHLLGETVDLTADLDVEWITHPHWFYRISKFTLPFLHYPCIPETHFLDQLKIIPKDLDQYVLKPLFSFAGQGVIIDVTKEDIDAVKNPADWILQKKVQYASCIATPNEPAKAEVRLMYIWKDGDERPTLATNLARLSKGKMIGVRYNKDKDWVGGSVAYFEKNTQASNPTIT